jgi:glycosyltransferase involved in cell wall biosynthesis
MKRVLMVSYYFPPFAGVSVERVKKFCKYLPGLDWEPVVYTVDPAHYKGKTVNDIGDVQNTEVHRIPYINFPGVMTIVKLFFPIFVLAFFLKNRKNYFDAVFFTGSPFHPFILTTIITGLFKVPTVLDFRDSWSSNFGFDGRHASNPVERFREWFATKVENLSIRFSSTTIFSTSYLESQYARKYRKYNDKYITIPNGYDPEDFVSVTPRIVAKTRTLILTGKFKIYTPDVVQGALHALTKIDDLTFVYVGSEYEELERQAKQLGVSGKLISMPYQIYQDMLSLISGADFAMLSTGKVDGVGTKIFDYLALKKPTICFVPKGSIISDQFGHVAHVVIVEGPHTKEKIIDGLEKLLAINNVSQDDLIQQYTRTKSTRELATILDKIIAVNSNG